MKKQTCDSRCICISRLATSLLSSSVLMLTQDVPMIAQPQLAHYLRDYNFLAWVQPVGTVVNVPIVFPVGPEFKSHEGQF